MPVAAGDDLGGGHLDLEHHRVPTPAELEAGLILTALVGLDGGHLGRSADWPDERIVVNLQGDEPAMPARLLGECAGLLDDATADIATLASPFATRADFESPNCVKVIRDDRGHAIYFSRAAIPFARDGAEDRARSVALHHHGIYAYRCGVLRRLVAASPSDIEICEQLEQLRALSLGMTITVGIPSERPGAGVDVADDIARVEAELAP